MLRSVLLLLARVALLGLALAFFSGTLLFLRAGGDPDAIVAGMPNPPTPAAPVHGAIARWCMHLSFLGSLPIIAYSMAAAACTRADQVRASGSLFAIMLLQLALLFAHAVAYIQSSHVPGFAAFLFDHGLPAAVFLVVFAVFRLLAPPARPAPAARGKAPTFFIDTLVTIFLYIEAVAFTVQGVVVALGALGVLELRAFLGELLPGVVQVVDGFDARAWGDTWTRFELCNWFVGHGWGIAAMYWAAARAHPASAARRRTLLPLLLLHGGIIGAHAVLAHHFGDEGQVFVLGAYELLYATAAAGTSLAHLWTTYGRPASQDKDKRE